MTYKKINLSVLTSLEITLHLLAFRKAIVFGSIIFPIMNFVNTGIINFVDLINWSLGVLTFTSITLCIDHAVNNWKS